jgi:hypothetical protein
MQTIDPPLVAALVAMCVGVLMVQAGIARRPVPIVPHPPHAKGTI